MARVEPAMGEGRSPRSGRSGTLRTLDDILDDDSAHMTVAEWRTRNLDLFDRLSRFGLIDTRVVSRTAHEYLTCELIDESNPATTDALNAGHVRAQNDNVLHYAMRLGLDARTLTIALEAAFIHDLNKSIGEPLRRDRHAVRDGSGEIIEAIETTAQCVGLNHLGERTRRALQAATGLDRGALKPEVADAIDRCIVHHGLGSSAFIRGLIAGNNDWWGDEFVEPETGARKIIHPPQLPWTLASLVHDLADSTQQMQGGLAWMLKYPEGFWKEAGLSYWQMLSDESVQDSRSIAMSLRRQIRIELGTCRAIIAIAGAELGADVETERALSRALDAEVRRTEMWIDDSPERLAKARARTIYHDVAKGLGGAPKDAIKRMKKRGPGHEELDQLVWKSARALDVRRTKDLARLIESWASG